MCRPDYLRRRGAVWLVFLLVLAGTGFFLGLALLRPDPPVAPASHPATADPAADPAADAKAQAKALSANATSPDAEARRVAAPATRADAPHPDFAEWVDQLVGMAQVTAGLVGEKRLAEAERNDAAVRSRFDELMATFPDAAEQALAVLAGLPPDSRLPLDEGRRRVLRVVLDQALADLHRAGEAAADRGRIDAVTGSLLTVVHGGGETATLGGHVLIERPYLRLVHEPAVLEIVELAGQSLLPRALATGLLTTLWRNLQSTGERSSPDLASMAMILMADADPSRRTAACRHLLLDPRYRAVALSWLRERDDLDVTTDITAIVARELPPPEASRVLRELSAVLPNMPGAYMALASRSESIVIDDYYALLGSDTHATVRRDLISGLGMARGPKAQKVVELALQDPASEVRAQAMLTLSGAAPDKAEAACNQLLDDPRSANDPFTLTVAVMALQNLESAGLINAVDRLGQRLRIAPLTAASRQRLEAILARALPGGRTSR